MIALLIFLSVFITFLIIKSVYTNNADIVGTTQFIKNNRKIFFVKMFAFTPNVSKESSISKEYLDFTEVFLKHNAKIFPSRHKLDLGIELKSKTNPIFYSIYNFSELELKKLK